MRKLKTGSKIETPLELLFTIFYGAAGIAQIGYYAIENATAPPHLPVLGILSLITAFSLFKTYKWTVPLAVLMFITGITLGATTLANSLDLQAFGDALLFNLVLIGYMIVLLIVSIYIVMSRENLS